MEKLSAGVVVYRINNEGKLQMLLVHPGGPFFKNKDEGAWSIPKGEYIEGEDPLEVAKREFTEETGNVLTTESFIPLTAVKIKSGKVISAWAVEAHFDNCFIKSNHFEMVWPPKSGKIQSFPEVDKAEWFTIDEAKKKINAGQVGFVEQLERLYKAQ
jgi:predicted NUDIX family NTP pyrophosphohydrolase